MIKNISPNALTRLSLSIQPLVFETEDVTYPYYACGTVFLVGYEGKTYVITTRHGLNPDNLLPICIFPSETSPKLLTLKNVFYVSKKYEQEDFVDLAIIEIDSSVGTDPYLNQTVIIDLALAFDPNWESVAETMEFFIIGYPSEQLNIDYAAEEIRTVQATLFGSYGGMSELPHLRLLRIENAHDFKSFDGFSGSPIFMWRTSKGKLPTPILCGMALRGTSSSKLIHFLPISIIIDAIKIKQQKHER